MKSLKKIALVMGLVAGFFVGVRADWRNVATTWWMQAGAERLVKSILVSRQDR